MLSWNYLLTSKITYFVCKLLNKIQEPLHIRKMMIWKLFKFNFEFKNFLIPTMINIKIVLMTIYDVAQATQLNGVRVVLSFKPFSL